MTNDASAIMSGTHACDNLCATITLVDLVCTYELCGRIIVFAFIQLWRLRDSFVLLLVLLLLASHCIALRLRVLMGMEE